MLRAASPFFSDSDEKRRSNHRKLRWKMTFPYKNILKKLGNALTVRNAERVTFLLRVTLWPIALRPTGSQALGKNGSCLSTR